MFVHQGKLAKGDFDSAFELERIPYTVHFFGQGGPQARATSVTLTVIQDQGINIASINGLGAVTQLKPYDYMVEVSGGFVRAYKYRNDPPKAAV